MRRVVLVILLAASCGDPPSGGNAPSADAPDAATFDDAQLETRVLDAARTGRFEGLASLKLPPRCDRVRVAVKALHDDLLGVAKDPPAHAALLTALDALAKCEGGADSKSLGPLVAAWRGWTDNQVAAEKDLAERAARCLFAVQTSKPFAQPLHAADASRQATPPMSPAAAQLQFFRAAELALDAPGDAIPKELAQECGTSQRLFAELGWPGGFGSLADELLPRLQKKNSKSFLAAYVADSARAAYGRSGDELRASLVFLAQADAAEKAGDFDRAERFADAARERLLPTGARGRELFDVLRRHGELAQKVGKQADAARDLGRALEEAKASRFGVDLRAPTATALATSFFRLGRFPEALEVARDEAKAHDDAVAAGASSVEPTRTNLDGLAAESASELGRAADAAELYRTMAARYEKLPPIDTGEWRTWGRDQALLLAARALAKGGDGDGAAKAVAEVLPSKLQPHVRAFAASVLREAHRLDDADRELTRAEKDGGAEFAQSLVAERARLAAARGDAATARALFAQAVDRATHGDANAFVGWDAASPLLDWARMEMSLGRLYEASELAGRAVNQLRGSGLEMELDRARKLYVDLQRRRLWFVDAEKMATQRLAAGDVGDAARREDALLDLLLIRIELMRQKQKDVEKNAAAVVAMFPDGWRRGLARAVVQAARDGHGAREPIQAPPGDALSRWRLLYDIASGDVFVRLDRRQSEEEPELRRWIGPCWLAETNPHIADARRLFGPRDIDEKEFVGTPDAAVLFVEPLGDSTAIHLLSKDSVRFTEATGDAGLADFWDATWVAPSPEHLAAAARRASSALFPKEIVDGLVGVKRLWISVSEPLGPLPFDLLPFGDGTLLDRFEVITVNSLTELSRCRDLGVPSTLPTLPSPYATLDGRQAVVQIGAVDPNVRARFLELLGKSLRTGKDASAAVRDAKLALRAEWKPDPKAPPTVPPWAAFLLRGAP